MVVIPAMRLPDCVPRRRLISERSPLPATVRDGPILHNYQATVAAPSLAIMPNLTRPRGFIDEMPGEPLRAHW
jgi:hypothetical protein